LIDPVTGTLTDGITGTNGLLGTIKTALLTGHSQAEN
jgi:hypothetical protein